MKSTPFRLRVVALGILAYSASGVAAPRATTTAAGQLIRPIKSPDTPREVAQFDSARLVAGGDEHLRSVVTNEGGIAGGAFVSVRPVEPLNGSTYPPGTSISGDTITYPGGDGLIWVDSEFGGWGDRLKFVQVTMLGVDGFVTGSGDPLSLPVVACADGGPRPHPTCEAAFGRWSQCKDGYCQRAWQDPFRPNYQIALPVGIPSSADYNANLRWGSVCSCEGFVLQDDGATAYKGSGIISVPPDAGGTYTIATGTADTGSFMVLDDRTWVAFTSIGFVIDIPTGTCCYTPESVSIACSDGLTQSQCMNEFPRPSYWNQGANCADFPCEPLLGACCDRATGTCAVTLGGDCPTANDPVSPWTAGVLCEDADCQPALGACCKNATAACSQTLRADCPGIDELEFAWLMETECGAIGCPLPLGAIPTVSEWGLVVMTLLLLIGAKIYFGRRMRVATQGSKR